jgi:hypothetical protein
MVFFDGTRRNYLDEFIWTRAMLGEEAEIDEREGYFFLLLGLSALSLIRE